MRTLDLTTEKKPNVARVKRRKDYKYGESEATVLMTKTD